MFVSVFFLPATVKGLRTRQQQGIHSFTVFIKLTTKLFIRMLVFRIIAILDGFYE